MNYLFTQENVNIQLTRLIHAKIVDCKVVTERNIIESSFITSSELDQMNVSLGLYELDNFIIG